MVQNLIVVNCQIPPEGWNISRTYRIIECKLLKDSTEYQELLEKANELASLVNGVAANNSSFNRMPKRKAKDALGGVLAEEGWIQFINSNFGNIASHTVLEDVNTQIDIKLTNGEKLEVRSSFPRRGVKFGICNNKFNFKNIGPYSNTVKPGEVQKDFYLAVLFDTQKKELLDVDEIIFSLVGGSTWNMMLKIGYDDPLMPYDDLIPIQSTYKVIELRNVLDSSQIIDAISDLGYKKI
jgi:hypothetical protein